MVKPWDDLRRCAVPDPIRDRRNLKQLAPAQGRGGGGTIGLKLRAPGKPAQVSNRVGEPGKGDQADDAGGDADAYGKSVVEVLKLKGAIEVVAPGSLPKDGLVIEDQRSYD